MIEHLEIIEIDLPVITGACNYQGGDGFGTPLTCDEVWSDELRTYRFCKPNALVLPGNLNVVRCIESISETVAEIRPGEGLGSRGSISITFSDIKGDPNDDAPGVTETVKNQGTYFGKLDFRQIVINKEIRNKLYEVVDGVFDFDNPLAVRHYIGESLTPSKNKWSLKGKDELSKVDLDEKVWPPSEDGFLRQDIDDAVLTILVDSNNLYVVGGVVRIGDELVLIDSVADIQGSNPTISTLERGAEIFNSDLTWSTGNAADSHNAGDEVFICHFANKSRIDDLLKLILTDSDMPLARIPEAEWANEIDTWWPNTFISYIYNEAEDANNVIARILTDYLTDIVFDAEERLIKLFAISVWKESTSILTEGENVILNSVTIRSGENIRATRALVVYDKTRVTDNDDTQNYKKASKFEDPRLQAEQFFGEHKDKLFENSPLLDDDSADLLVQRWVSRFGVKPKFPTCEIPEAKLTINLGDVIDYRFLSDQGADGLPNTNARAQVISIKPKYKGGRTYQVKLASYEAVAESGTEFILNNVNQINLFTQAGNPPEVVELTFIIDTARTSSGDTNIPSIFAGNFVSGSKITIIFVNGSEGQSKGGQGGQGEGGIFFKDFWIKTPPTNGLDGGIVYDANGVDTEIFLSGPTSSVNFPSADGFILAPSGGDGGQLGFFDDLDEPGSTAGNGGRGGDGDNVGLGGLPGDLESFLAEPGEFGASGKLDGTGSGYGFDGVNNDALGGLKGKGIITGGAIVNVFGGGGGRLINGGGDAVGNPLNIDTLLTPTTEMGDFN